MLLMRAAEIESYSLKINHCLAILFFGLIFNSAHANPVDEQLSLLGSPWFQKCPKENERATKNCVIEQSIYLANESKTRLATIGIEVLKGGQEALLRFMVPLEVLLPLGLNFEISEKKTIKGFYLFCDVNGCYSQIKLDKEGLQNLMASKTFIVTYSHLKSANKNNEVRLALEATDLSIKIKDLIKKSSK